MIFYRKPCRFLRVLICICMTAALCPAITGTAANNLTGDDDSTISISNSDYYTTASTEGDTEVSEIYEEPDLYEGSNALSLSSAQTDCTITNKVPGLFGKAADDFVYRLDIAGSTSTGYNFISSATTTLDTVNFEFSFAVTDDTAGMLIETSYYKTAKAANKITVDGAEVSNTIKGNILSISGGKVSSGSTSAFASGSKSKVLYEGKPGEWINIAIVTPGYNQTSAGTEKILIYVNGIKHEILTSVPLYGIRHMRLSPSTKSTFYLDNVRTYKGAGEEYSPDKDLKPVFDENTVDAFDGNINVASGTTAGQFKKCFAEDITVRVFTNNKLTDLLNDTDTMNSENMVVLATKNNRTTERAYSYFTVNTPLSIKEVKLTNADGKIIRGSSSDISRIGETYYLATTVSNKATLSSASFKAVVTAYDSLGNMTYCNAKDVTVAPGTTTITSVENSVAFEDVITPEGGTLKAFLWAEDTLKPLCEGFKAEFNGVEEYNILTIGNSYSNNSLIYLPAIAAEDGVIIRAVNLYEGGCPIEYHYGFMTGTRSDGYDHVYQHTVDGSVSLGKNVTFEDGFNTPGYTWDYITLHQKGQYSPFYNKYYTEEKPYITEIAEYVKQNSPGSEFLFFENWAPYTDRIEENWSVYKSLCEGLEREEYIPTVFSAIKDCYLKAAAQIGNPNRIIPAGEAIYLATQKYGFTDYVDDSSTTNESFKDAAGAMYLDQSSHLTTYGKILSALTWYEYLTGHDVTQNTYQNSKVSAEDMALLKQIAHEACLIEDYIPQK